MGNLDDITNQKIKDVKTVRELSQSDLENISVSWATEEHELLMLGAIDTHSFSTVFTLNVSRLIETLDFGDISPDNFLYEHLKSDYKYSNLVLKWMNGQKIDCPVLSLNKDGELSIADGRHRIITASKLGEKTIPVMIYPKSVTKTQLSEWL